MGKFESKVVIVTGASGGIGQATAVAFAKEGAKVSISGRNKERLNETAKKCKEAGGQVLEIVGDLTNFDTLEPLINKTVETFGGIDVLINNAGYASLCPIDKLDLSTYENIFQSNVRAPVFLCQYAIPHLKKTKGCVVNVSSCAAFRATANLVPYCMTKSALDSFTRGFSAECAPFGVRVNSINPGAVDTKFFDKLGLPAEARGQMLENISKTHPLGFMKPEDVSEAILFLCSSPMITGVSLPIDAGLMNSSYKR